MIVLDDAASMLAALDLPLDPKLRGLLASRVRHTVDGGLGDLTTIVVAFSTDAEGALADEIGGSLLFDPISGRRHGEPGFSPSVDWVEAHHGWWTLIRCVGDGGFAYVVLVEERDDALGRMCHALAAE